MKLKTNMSGLCREVNVWQMGRPEVDLNSRSGFIARLSRVVVLRLGGVVSLRLGGAVGLRLGWTVGLRLALVVVLRLG